MEQLLLTVNLKRLKVQDDEVVDVGLIMVVPSGSSTHVDNLITIGEERCDCIWFHSKRC